MNLAVNAKDAMPRGGKLHIQTRTVILDEDFREAFPEVQPGPYVRLSVTDTGHGMDENVLAHVWEPFFTTKPVGEGTGLGLATVYGIVKGHSGHVDVESKVGSGTTFHVYLPTHLQFASPRHETVALTLPRGTETILVVEDEEAVRGVARLVLQRLGYTVLEAAGGDEALALMEQIEQPVHLLLTDVVMPGMGGREVADRLRSRCPGLKVLFMSGYTDDAVVRHGIEHHEVEFIQKPFSGPALANKVREVLEK
jgi:CheY-like chemotaxis protein